MNVTKNDEYNNTSHETRRNKNLGHEEQRNATKQELGLRKNMKNDKIKS